MSNTRLKGMLQESSETHNLPSDVFSHTYFKASQKHSSAVSDDEDEEVESRFRGAPQAFTADLSASFTEPLPQSTKFALTKIQDKNVTNLMPAAHQKLLFSEEAAESDQSIPHALPQGLADHCKDTSSSWLDSLRHRKRPFPFAKDKQLKQAANIPSTPQKKTVPSAGAKKLPQGQTTLPSIYGKLTPQKSAQIVLQAQESTISEANDRGHEALPEKMEDCKLTSPQTGQENYKPSHTESQQNALAILMSGESATRLFIADQLCAFLYDVERAEPF